MSDDTVWKGIEEFRPFLKPIGQLKLDPRNARKHSDRNIQIVQNSLEAFGQHRVAILSKDNCTCLIGNAMLKAARNLGWTHLSAVPCDDEQAQAIVRSLIDNRSGDPEVGSEWDFPVLADIIEEIDTGALDFESIGWTQEELEQLMTWTENPESKDSDDKDGKSDRRVIECPKCGEMFVPKKAQTPEQKAAVNAVYRALKNGTLIKPDKCEKCGQGGKINGHHEDYSKPLEVQWLCSKCHNVL